MKNKIIKILAISSIALFTESCNRDFVDTQFYQGNQASPLTSIEQLKSFMYGTYSAMRATEYYGRDFRADGEVHTDEIFCNGNSGYNVAFAGYSLLSNTATVTDTWSKIYLVVSNANVIINSNTTGLTWGGSSNPAAIKAEANYIKGQAYAVRALAFFDLLRLYGQTYSGDSDLGIVIPTTYNPKANMPRASIADTRAQIENDFAAALANMSGYSEDFTSKTTLNSLAVKSLMTRYYLYKGDYAAVRKYAADVINSKQFIVAPKSDLVASFGKDQPQNSIFELAVGKVSAYGAASYSYLLNSDGYANLQPLDTTYDIYDSNDIRQQLFDNDGFLGNKFPDLTGSANVRLIRFEEVLLNGAEAELNGGSKSNAIQYINQIITNRGLDAISDINLDAVKLERMKELVGEGFRYWDLLRWGSVIPYYNQTGARDTKLDKTVKNHLLAFPIPQTETNVAGTAIVSNPGYDN